MLVSVGGKSEVAATRGVSRGAGLMIFAGTLDIDEAELMMASAQSAVAAECDMGLTARMVADAGTAGTLTLTDAAPALQASGSRRASWQPTVVAFNGRALAEVRRTPLLAPADAVAKRQSPPRSWIGQS